MGKKESHIHKYEKVTLGKHVIYKCALIGCPHHIRRELVTGRVSICWRCETPFPMTKHAATLVRPHCISCTKSEKKEDLDILRDYLDKLTDSSGM